MATTVLVVEDDLEINELIGEYFALENIKPLQAPTGKGGIHLAQEKHPDVIILDLMLPDIDGYEVARTLSSQRATADIPIIILSCMCLVDDKNKGFANGAFYYMNKPFLPDDLLATVRQALDWKASLATRPAAGTIALGLEPAAGSRAINQMTAELFARTVFPDADVWQMRQAIELLDTWARQWNTDHKTAQPIKLEYRISPAALPAAEGSQGAAEWKLLEDKPGLLDETFFKTAPAASSGWGAMNFLSRPAVPVAPPAKWLEILLKTGAPCFEKDSKARVVRFARQAHSAPPASAAVPVVEIGLPANSRLRGEAIAAQQN